MHFKKHLVAIILSSLLVFNVAHGITLNSSKELQFFADALNIEGGRIPKYKLNKNQIWSNLCVVLDTPLSNGINLTEITKGNTYSLKEASIPEYNEVKVNYMYLLSLSHYLENSRKYVNKPESSPVNIVAQVHRWGSANNQIRLMLDLLKKYYPSDDLVLVDSFTKQSDDNKIVKYYYHPTNTYIEFRRGYDEKYLEDYKEADIIYSLSLVAGLNSKLKASDLILPNMFTPFGVNSLEFDTKESYLVSNHLLENLEKILNSGSSKIIDIVNDYGSENSNKSHKLYEKLKLNDFRNAIMAQSDGLFNPNFK